MKKREHPESTPEASIDFKHDENVDRELSVYEDIANAYTACITANPSIGKELRVPEALARRIRIAVVQAWVEDTGCRDRVRGMAPGLWAKREVYGLLLVRSGATEEEALARTRLHVLDRTQAREVLRRYTHSPRPIRARN